MADVPYNLPSISGHTIVGFSKLWNGALQYEHSYAITTRIVPTVSARAGNITGLQLRYGNDTQTVSGPVADGIAQSDDLAYAPADALVFSNVSDAPVGEPQSTMRMWCMLGQSGGVYFHLVVVGPGTSDNAAIHFIYENQVSLKVTTGNVLNNNNEMILRGNDFTFPIQIYIFGKDLPRAQTPCFYEYEVGESVFERFRMDAWCNRHEFVGDAYGCSFPESNVGGKIVSPDGYWSGLTIEHVEDYDDYSGHFYVWGVKIHGTALRPGVYVAHLFVQSYIRDHEGGGVMAEFAAGEDNNIIIISIRERCPLPGDLMLMIPHQVASVPENYLSVTHCGHDLLWWVEGIIERDMYSQLILPYSWTFVPDLWDESRPGGAVDSTMADIAEILIPILGDDVTQEEIDAYFNSRNNDLPPTGHLHHPGFWYRRHDWYTPDHPHHVYDWYVIVRDVLNDETGETRGVWRLYCSSELSADYLSWHVVATASEIGLLNEYVTRNDAKLASRIENPPKTWHFVDPNQVTQTICFKGSERCVVENHGVFSHAGYLNIELPLPEDAEPDAEPEVVTVEVLQQQPLFTAQYDGWSSLNFWPPEYQYTSNSLLYEHPVHGWILVDDLNSEITEQNRATPVPITHVGIPYAPAAPPMVVGGNANAIRRDIVLSDGNRGMSVSNIDGTGRWNGHKMALLGGMAASGMFNGGIVWPHYPLTRIVNFERLRMKITAKVKVNLLGGPVGVGVDDVNESGWTSSAGGTPSMPSSPKEGSSGWGHSKTFYSWETASDVQGKCIAKVAFEDVPCWYNGYMIFAEVRNASASLIGDEGDESYNNGISFKTGTFTRDIYTGDSYRYIDGVWHRSSGGTGDVEAWFGVKTGVLTANRCRINVWVRGTIGHGREINLCPAKIMGSDRPSEQIVFAGEMGVDATWVFEGNCKYQEEKWGKYNVKRWEDDEDGGHWDTFPTPEDSPLEDSTVKLSHSAGRSWTTGLQVWQIKNHSVPSANNKNVLHGKYVGEHRSYRQSGYCLYVENEDTLDQRTVSYSSWGNCEFNAGTGGISGRTTYGSSLAPGETMKYPILYYGGNAHCRIITNGRLSEYQYPDDDTLTPTAQGALDAYEDFVKKVMNCSEDAPAVADWRDDGAEVRTEFNGYRSEENREDDIEMTVEIQEN